jgi:RNA polymerase sigma-70 factor, ECF subfamily
MDSATHELEQMYHEMAPTLLAYFRRQPTLANSAEDLLQDTFVRAFRGFDRLRKSVSPRAYLFGIARHVGLDALRRLRPMEAMPAEIAPAGHTDKNERLESMRAAIEELPDVHREVLHLKLHHELSYAEIAEVLGVPLGTVRSRLHHAVIRLRNRLNPPPSPPANP